jgi:Holliday junction resolvase
MTNQDLMKVILNDRKTIAEVIATGAAWEIWMQVELMFLLRKAGMSVARELPYPKPYEALHIDLLAKDQAGYYAIELKVESANNAGRALLVNAKQDIVKISDYAIESGIRAVVAIGYSGNARESLKSFATVPTNNAIYADADRIGVLIANIN